MQRGTGRIPGELRSHMPHMPHAMAKDFFLILKIKTDNQQGPTV